MIVETIFSVILLFLAAISFLAGGFLVLDTRKWAIQRNHWVLLGSTFFLLTIFLGVTIYQYLVYGQPDVPNPIVSALMVFASGFACSGVYAVRKQMISEAKSRSNIQKDLDRYRLSFEKEPYILVIKDNQGAYMAVNEAYASLFKKTSHELIGESDFNFFPRSQAMAFRQEEEKVLKSENSQTQEVQIQGIKGVRWYQLNRIPLKNGDNAIIGILTTGHDITAHKKVESALNEWGRGATIWRKAEYDFGKQDNLDSIYSSLLKWAHILGESIQECLWLVIPEKSTAILKAGSEALKPYEGVQLKPGQDLVWRVWEGRKPIFDKDYRDGPESVQWAEDLNLQSGVGIPMQFNHGGGVVITLFYNERLPSYQQERITLLGLLAQTAATRIDLLGDLDAAKRNILDGQSSLSELQSQAGLNQLFATLATQFLILDPQKIDDEIQKALASLTEKTGVDNCYLYLFPNSDYGRTSQRLFYSNASMDNPVEMSTSKGVFTWCIERIKHFEIVQISSAVDRTGEDQQARKFLQSRSIQFFMAVPLIENHSVIGFLGFESAKFEKPWTVDSLNRLKIGSEIFARILQRKWNAQAALDTQEQMARNIQVLERESRQISTIAEMGDLLQSCRTADEAYPIITRYIRRLIPVGSGSLYIIIHTQDPAERVVTWGSLLPSPLEHELIMNECWALRRGRPYVVADPKTDPMCAHVKDPSNVSYICIPLIAQGVAIGMLHFRQNQANSQFSQQDQQIAIKISEFTSMALTNLRLRDELRSQAIRDPLTGLFNRRYMEETLDREIRRANRHGTSVGVIMFDIDKMKPINDKLGHDAGDLILRTLGDALRNLFRREDVACRFGGDEFTIVLPEASLAAAWQRAEQMRETIKNLNLQYDGKKIGPITLSIGVAAYPDHGPTVENLLLASDTASYAAKTEGGDRIMVGHRDDV